MPWHTRTRGVIHRDLKPGNVMIGAEFGEVQVMDWGVAKVLSAPEEPPAYAPVVSHGDTWHDAVQTRNDSILGTFAYMSPEQARGLGAEVDTRSDVFGLGAILCEILTGAPPYTAPAREALQKQARDWGLTDALARLRGCGADPELIGLAERCLARDRGARPADAGAVAAVVEAYLAAAQERVRQAQLASEREKVKADERRRRRALWAALAVSAFVAIGAVAYLSWPTPPLPPEPPAPLRIGIKPWVGYTPLVVAKELNLYGDVAIKFRTVTSVDEAADLFKTGELDVVLWLVDWQVRAASRPVPADVKVVLVLDESYEADAVVVRENINSVRDLLNDKNALVGYQEREPSEYMLKLLCDESGVDFDKLPLDIINPWEAPEGFKNGRRKDGKTYNAVGTYAPHVEPTLNNVPRSKMLINGGDERVKGDIVDILTVRKRIFEEQPDKVKQLIRGWFEAVSLLQSPQHARHKEAVQWALLFNGDPPGGTGTSGTRTSLRIIHPFRKFDFERILPNGR